MQKIVWINTKTPQDKKNHPIQYLLQEMELLKVSH